MSPLFLPMSFSFSTGFMLYPLSSSYLLLQLNTSIILSFCFPDLQYYTFFFYHFASSSLTNILWRRLCNRHGGHLMFSLFASLAHVLFVRKKKEIEISVRIVRNWSHEKEYTFNREYYSQVHEKNVRKTLELPFNTNLVSADQPDLGEQKRKRQHQMPITTIILTINNI